MQAKRLCQRLRLAFSVMLGRLEESLDCSTRKPYATYRLVEAFVKTLQAAGVTFDAPFREVPAIGLKIAFILDPVGTRIELTEGLTGK